MTPREEFTKDFFEIVDKLVYLMVEHGKNPENQEIANRIDNIGAKVLEGFVEKWGPKSDT